MIKFDTLHKKWMKEPGYRKEYEALEEEFALIAEMAKARARAGLSQAQLARQFPSRHRAQPRRAHHCSGQRRRNHLPSSHAEQRIITDGACLSFFRRPEPSPSSSPYTCSGARDRAGI